MSCSPSLHTSAQAAPSARKASWHFPMFLGIWVLLTSATSALTPIHPPWQSDSCPSCVLFKFWEGG